MRHSLLTASFEPNQPSELEDAERIAPLTRSSPCEDYRIKGRDRLRTMTLDAAEFIFSPAHLARRLPPHPPLRPLRRRRVKQILYCLFGYRDEAELHCFCS
jgi:hypothetical protein